jgi:hypothetical protein
MQYASCALTARSIFEQIYVARWERIEGSTGLAPEVSSRPRIQVKQDSEDFDLSWDVSWLDDDEWNPETVLTILARIGPAGGSAFYHQGVPLVSEGNRATSAYRSQWT